MRNLRKAQAMLRLAGKYHDVIEMVAERALLYVSAGIKAMLGGDDRQTFNCCRRPAVGDGKTVPQIPRFL